MNIAVSPSRRAATIEAPAGFAVGEAMPLSVSGLDTPNVPTLMLALYATDGTPLALCDTFAAGDGVWTGTLDTRTTAAVAAFDGKRPDERIPVIAAMGDSRRLWFSTGAEMCNHPLRSAPVAPDPPPTFLVASMFADVDDPGDEPSYR